MTTIQHSPTEPTEHRAERLGTVIIGAGQTGLATAYFLGKQGVDYVVLDEHERVGDQWRQRYDSLLLNSPAVQVLRAAQARLPALYPGGVVDSAPLMQPPFVPRTGVTSPSPLEGEADSMQAEKS